MSTSETPARWVPQAKPTINGIVVLSRESPEDKVGKWKI
jgi:hypothetical protein